VDAVLQAWYPGARGGEAIARLLFGEASPSGRLPVGWPHDESQLPRPVVQAAGFRNPDPPAQTIDYFEGANVGYKWFAARKREPLFPFGYGLGYTRFAYEKLNAVVDGQRLRVYFDVVNKGDREGADVPQVYLHLPESSDTPVRLIGWKKAMLKPGERRRFGIEADPRLLAGYGPETGRWRIEGGHYRVVLGSSAADIAQSVEIELEEWTLDERQAGEIL